MWTDGQTTSRLYAGWPQPPQSLLTHIALPVRDLAATLAFYERFTDLVNIHERHDPETDLRTAWLANERDTDDSEVARFVIVLIEGKLPKAITGDIKEEYGFLTSISHLGISLQQPRRNRRNRRPCT